MATYSSGKGFDPGKGIIMSKGISNEKISKLNELIINFKSLEYKNKLS